MAGHTATENLKILNLFIDKLVWRLYRRKW